MEKKIPNNRQMTQFFLLVKIALQNVKNSEILKIISFLIYFS